MFIFILKFECKILCALRREINKSRFYPHIVSAINQLYLLFLYFRNMRKIYMCNTASVLLETETADPLRVPEFNSGFFLCIVLLYVFKFWVPCCDVHYGFRIKTMLCSSLPSVVCRRAHILFTSFVWFCA